MITFILIVLVLILALLIVFLLSPDKKRLHAVPLLRRIAENPVLEPIALNWWESEAVFNPAAIVEGGRVHLFYRALGRDGISRIGYASSADGINFDERLPFPVYAAENVEEAKQHHAYTSPARLTYDTINNPSGGGWGGGSGLVPCGTVRVPRGGALAIS